MKYFFYAVLSLVVCAIVLGILFISPVLLSFGLIFYIIPKKKVIAKKPMSAKTFLGEFIKNQIS